MYQQVLLTLDGSELARAAVRHAPCLLRDTDTRVVVFQTIESEEALRARSLSEAYEFTGGDTQAIQQLAKDRHFLARTESLREVEWAKQQLQSAGVTSVQGEVGEGVPGNAIIDAADRHDVDAILMATRGHGGLGREVVGSVAEYVLRHAGDRAIVLVGPRTHSHEASRAHAAWEV